MYCKYFCSKNERSPDIKIASRNEKNIKSTKGQLIQKGLFDVITVWGIVLVTGYGIKSLPKWLNQTL